MYIKKLRTQFLKDDNSSDWDEELILQMILLLNESMKSFSIRAMGLHKRPIPDPILSSFLGRDCSRKFLYHAACSNFGSWNSALEEAGIRPTRIAKNKIWTSELIIRCVKELHCNNHPLTVKEIWRDRSRKTSQILRSIVGKKTTGSALHDAARRIIGSWDKALSQAGVNIEEVKEKPFWSKSKIISAIHAIHRAGIPLNAKSISRDQSRETKKIIKKKIGKPRSGKSLFGGAYRAFGSWDRALSESGICTKDVRQEAFFWKKSSIKRILCILSELNVPVNSYSIRKDNSEQTKNIIYNYTGQMETGSKIFRLGYKLIGPWDDVLRLSGLKLSEVRRSGSQCERNKEQIIDYIRTLNRHEFSLNHAAVKRESHKSKLIIENHFGSPVSGKSILVAANLMFGSWREALWKAGLDPSMIILRSRTRVSTLPVILSQVEDIQAYGERKLSRFAGNPSKRPEDILEERESTADLNTILSSLSANDRRLAENIFDIVLQIHHYKDQDDLIKHIKMRMDNEISEKEIRALFIRMQMARTDDS